MNNTNLDLWKGTDGWSLAKAVRDEDSAKMKIVNYIKEHGQDYRKTPIPKDIQRYYSKKYLDQY
ncbi:hypothetical protein [Bacteroides sedimenti]